jgi:hypothetical protein
MTGSSTRKPAVAKKAAARQVAKASPPRVAVAGKSARKSTNSAAKKPAAQKAAPGSASRKRLASAGAKQPTLLAGGNPQIPKGHGDVPVQAYIAAMPGWKQDIGRRIDAIIERTVPGVHKAVKWNSPFYGVDDKGWFLSLHCYTRYVKVAFFRGMSLRPVPPSGSKSQDTRYLDIREDAPFDEAQFAKWVKQASALLGERM